jgi:membrane protease YdiL (CAAX protease family)
MQRWSNARPKGATGQERRTKHLACWAGAGSQEKFLPSGRRRIISLDIPFYRLWVCFAIALVGIRRSGRITLRELVGARWSRWQTIIGDLGIALATFVSMAVIGNLSNAVLPSQHDSAALQAMVAQNTAEALAFLALALTAGFVEEFVFRGYIQRQCQALCGSTVVASILQLIIFTSGHLYQGWIRLVPVFLIGIVVTIVALWRKSLIPGMIAHGLGDSLVAFSFFFKHL